VRIFLLSMILSGLMTSHGAVASAQQNTAGANASRYGVGVVDVNYIFKNYKKFTSSMEAMKGEMEKVDGKLKVERQLIQDKEDQLRQYKPSSPEHKQLDEEIARLKAEFTLTAGRIRKDFLEREAKVYYQTYLEVSNAVKHYASQHNIGLVLRFNGSQIDPAQRKDLLQAINRPIVFQNSIDITPDVLAVLGRSDSGTEVSGRPQPATR